MDIYMVRLFYVFGITFFLCIGSVFGQLSDLHYLPPLKQGGVNQAVQQQSVYLSTPVTTAFSVNVYRGTSTTPLTTLSLSNTTSIQYTLTDGDNNITLVSNTNTGIVLTNSGLRFEAAGGQKFYVNYRGRSAAQATSLTSKGRQSMGRLFKWGGIPNVGTHTSLTNTLGIMATEDNTTVDIFGYDPGCEFRLQNDADGITSNTIQVTLDAGESYVLEAIKAEATANVSGWIGATVQSDKDIVISNGGLNVSVVSGSAQRDAAIDQPVAEDKLGKEYVFVRGNGVDQAEFPIIIGTENNTDIYVNGAATPITTINNGDFFTIPGSNYSTGTAGGNMLVVASKNVYAYQCMAGSTAKYTIGLNFIAPVNCLLPDNLDNIPDIRNIAGLTATGGITIIASTTTPNVNINVTDGSGSVTLPAPLSVTGSSDWKTFYVSGLTGDVSVQSTGPIAVGFIGVNSARGIAGYFSGFDTVPNVDLELAGGGCLPSATIQIVEGTYDGYQWFINGNIIVGATSASYTPTIAGDFHVQVTKGACTYDSNPLPAYYCSVISNRKITHRVNKD